MSSIDRSLRFAAGDGDEAELKKLLRNPSCNALHADEIGNTALMYAARISHEACVELLLPVSDALAQNNKGWTALMCAAFGGNEACVRLLLPTSDALTSDRDGFTASAWARSARNESLAQFIDAYVLSQTEQASIEAAAGPGAASGKLELRI